MANKLIPVNDPESAVPTPFLKTVLPPSANDSIEDDEEDTSNNLPAYRMGHDLMTGILPEQEEYCMELICRDWTARMIVQALETRHGIPYKEATKVLHRCKRRLRRIIPERKEHLLGEMLMRHALIRQKLMEQGEYETLLKFDKEDASLLGLYSPTKVAPTDPSGENEYRKLSDSEAAARVLAILDSAAEKRDLPSSEQTKLLPPEV